jgi:hypothetical protein
VFCGATGFSTSRRWLYGKKINLKKIGLKNRKIGRRRIGWFSGLQALVACIGWA